MKIRLAYTKKGEARYIAHLDLTRVLDRALRRAEIPVAFSEGFNPHPKIAFGPPLPVGVEGEQEYVDISLKEPANGFRDKNDEDGYIQDIVHRLQRELPPGIDIAGYGFCAAGTKALMAVINLARYQTAVSYIGSLNLDMVEMICNRWLSREQVIYGRIQQGKRIEKDIRPYVKAIIPLTETSICLDIVTGNSGSVRPVEVLESLRELEMLPIDIPGVKTSRTGLFIEQADGKLLTPLEIVIDRCQ
ncbi:TIGR03936 family radical SAM-associated protein [Dehalobacter sp. DCM]|uniref:TIGR03936 family radical SAM-associated protein n=1 Tax=Dehalobacter sp. DCM TaxID=2907827 RepID=UPI003081A130|nr:TIGR03936 family radical SAM-associated protein [Dehalobacter sp. DCM]